MNKPCASDKSRKCSPRFESNVVNYMCIAVNIRTFRCVSRTPIYSRSYQQFLINTSHQTLGEVVDIKSDTIVNNNKLNPSLYVDIYVPSVYLANIQYVSGNDYRKALETCNRLMTPSNEPIIVCLHMFPIVLSTRCSVICDAEIQATLGFLFLFGNVVESTTTAFTFCPLRSVCYVEVQCLMKTGRSKDLIRNKFLHNFWIHAC